MFTDIIKQLDRVNEKIKQSELCTDPWPHMIINDVFDKDFYSQLLNFSEYSQLRLGDTELGRNQYEPDVLNNSKVASSLKDYNELTAKIFLTIADKFGVTDYNDRDVPATLMFWEDSHRLEIVDIHVDAFDDTEFTLSGQFYVPVDNSLVECGTSLYKYTGDDIYRDAEIDDNMPVPHTVRSPDSLHLFEYVKKIPFLPNTLVITPNTQESWHSAPTNIPRGKKRNSIMMRWKV